MFTPVHTLLEQTATKSWFLVRGEVITAVNLADFDNSSDACILFYKVDAEQSSAMQYAGLSKEVARRKGQEPGQGNSTAVGSTKHAMRDTLETPQRAPSRVPPPPPPQAQAQAPAPVATCSHGAVEFGEKGLRAAPSSSVNAAFSLSAAATLTIHSAPTAAASSSAATAKAAAGGSLQTILATKGPPKVVEIDDNYPFRQKVEEYAYFPAPPTTKVNACSIYMLCC